MTRLRNLDALILEVSAPAAGVFLILTYNPSPPHEVVDGSTYYYLKLRILNIRTLDTLSQSWGGLWKLKLRLHFPLARYWPATSTNYLHNPPRSVRGLQDLHFTAHGYKTWWSIARTFINKCFSWTLFVQALQKHHFSEKGRNQFNIT